MSKNLYQPLSRIPYYVYRMFSFLFMSRYSLLAIIILFIIQASWLALSFRFPMIYDEGTHMGFIVQYSDEISPYTNDTPGNMTTQISLFHYLMSFIYRLMSVFTDSTFVLVVVCRLICIGMVATGMYILAKTCIRAGVPRGVTAIGMLLFTSLPMVPLVAATINNDNLLFLTSSIFFFYMVKIINDSKLNWLDVALLVSIGCISALVKYTFLPIFLISIILTLCFSLKNKKKFNGLLTSFRGTSFNKRLAMIALLTVSTGLFLLVYMGNVIMYKSLQPACTEVLPQQVCQRNGVVQRNKIAKETADSRPTVPIDDFSYRIWFGSMLNNTVWSGNSTENGVALRPPLYITKISFFVSVILGACLLLYAWRTLRMTPAFKVLLLVALSLFGVLFLKNLSTYYSLHQPYAIQPRYLMSVLPIVVIAVVYAAYVVTRGKRTLQTFVVALVLMMSTQGGGIITHILLSEKSWYWDSDVIVDSNQMLKGLLSKVVKER